MRAAVSYDRMVPPARSKTTDLAREAGRDHQPRHRGAAARAHPLSHLLGKLAGTALLRRSVQGHRRSGPGARRRLFDREPPAARARVAAVGAPEAAQGHGADPGRDQPRDQHRRASGAGRRADRPSGATGGARERDRRHRLRFRAGDLFRARAPADHVGKLEALVQGANLASKELWPAMRRTRGPSCRDETTDRSGGRTAECAIPASLSRSQAPEYIAALSTRCCVRLACAINAAAADEPLRFLYRTLRSRPLPGNRTNRLGALIIA